MKTAPQISELDEKIQKAQADLANAREQENASQILFNLRRLGQLYLDGGDAPQALTHYNEALKLVADTDDMEAHAQILGFRGVALKLIGNFSLALQSFRKSNAVASSINHAALTCDSYIQIAMIKSEMGETTEAISNLSRAMAVAQEKNDLARKMRIASLLGDNFYKIEAFDKAVDYSVLGSEIARELRNQAAEVSFLTKVANIFLLEGEIKSAVGQYERALKIASAIEDRNAEINILGGLFRAHALDGDVRLATVYGDQVIHLARDSKHAEAEYSNIAAFASFLAEKGKVEDAIPYLERGLQIADEQNNLDLKSDMLIRLGLAYSQQQQPAQALEEFNLALEMTRTVSDARTQARILGYIASLQADEGNLQASIAAAEGALSLAQELEIPELMAEQQILLAFNYRDLGQIEKAVHFCKAGIASYQDIGQTELTAQANTLLAELEDQA
jgi:tetratricopeptide (TPR) repeat protein